MGVLATCLALAASSHAGAATSGPGIDFGPLRLDESRTQTAYFFAEYPAGDDAEQMAQASVQGEAAADFTTVSDSCSNAQVEAACRVVVAFRPSAAGLREATLTLPGAQGAAIVPLTGRGVVIGPRISLSAAGADPALPVSLTAPANGLSRPRQVSVVSTGDVPVDVALSLAGQADDFVLSNSTCHDAALEPGDGCTADLRFVPGPSGRAEAVLRASCGGSCDPRELRLVGTVPPLPPPPSLLVETSVQWSVSLLGARGTRSGVVVRVYTSLPATFTLRLRRNGGDIARVSGSVRPGTRLLRMGALQLAPGRGYRILLRATAGRRPRLIQRFVGALRVLNRP